MRPFVSDFLLPVVRGGPAQVGRPLGLSAVARFMADLPLNDDGVIAKLAAGRTAIATRVSPVATPPPPDETTLRLGAALHDLPALGFPTMARVVAGQAVAAGVDRSGDALADALYRFASFHDPPPGIDASPEAVAFAVRFLAHLVWLDVLFGGGRAADKTESTEI